MRVLPREGGVLDQDASDMVRLEAILQVFAEVEEKEARKNQSRQKMRTKHLGDAT